jgi:hypothetical protein
MAAGDINLLAAVSQMGERLVRHPAQPDSTARIPRFHLVGTAQEL